MSKFIPKNMIPLTVVAKKALHEALSFGLPGGSSFGGLGRLGGMDTGGDPLMNWSRTKRPLGSLEIPSGSVEDTQDAFSGTLQRMGYKSSIDPETGKEQLFAPRKETTKKLEQSPVSFSGGRGRSTPKQVPTRTLPGYTGQHPVTSRTVEQERLDQQTVDRAADEVFRREGVKTAAELAAENERKKQQPGYVQSSTSPTWWMRGPGGLPLRW